MYDIKIVNVEKFRKRLLRKLRNQQFQFKIDDTVFRQLIKSRALICLGRRMCNKFSKKSGPIWFIWVRIRGPRLNFLK